MKFFKVVLFLITLFTLSNLEANAQSRFNRENRPVKISQPTGIASYYGRAWNGRKTACGEVFNTDSFTCAHRTLPFGTMLKVTNKKNGKSVVVRVTDRGPYAKGRIIDLTLAAAKKIDMVNAGVTPVEIAQVYTPSTIPTASDNDNPVLPEMQLFDPVTGNYYSMSEWQQRDQHRRDMVKAKTATRQSAGQTATAKAAQPKAAAKPVAQATAKAKPAAKPAAK
ncbi:MAG: septal ring lytic transglycosylase RlpA family protein, partial [Bacteroidales bacterium]|nr:septal ring lytic transglycosylase RlpA family protein [Bacteroidales bacterium]